MNPFGIEHEPLSKSFTKLAPKLSHALRTDIRANENATNMNSKLRGHGSYYRLTAGEHGKTARKFGGKHPTPFLDGTAKDAAEKKKAAHGMYSAVSQMNRQERRLP